MDNILNEPDKCVELVKELKEYLHSEKYKYPEDLEDFIWSYLKEKYDL